MVNFNKTQTVRKINFHHIKKEVVAIFTDVTDFDMNINLYLHPNSNYYCQLNVKCAFLKDKKFILLLHIYIYIYIYAIIIYIFCIYIYMGVFKYNTGGGGSDYHMCT